MRMQLRYSISAASLLLVGVTAVYVHQRTLTGQQPQRLPHPHPRPFPPASTVTVSGNTVTVITGQSTFPPPRDVNPYTNLLPNIYTNAYDATGAQIPNTLPSTPSIPYNLHNMEPLVSIVNLSGNPNYTPSPEDDLPAFFDAIVTGARRKNDLMIRTAISLAIDVLEGNPTKAGRAYSGLPVLHYHFGEKVKKVDPITQNVNIHQVRYNKHIESDTSYLDVRGVADVPWTITYTVDVLNLGHEDFSPFALFLDARPPGLPPSFGPPPGVAMDQTFYNMEDGRRYVFKIRMPPGKYFYLVYNWGWRAPSVRAQIIENACTTQFFQTIPPNADCGTIRGSPEWSERQVFFRDDKPDKTYAINQLSKYAPEVRMWTALHDAMDALEAKQYQRIVDLFRSDPANPGAASIAFEDWTDRSRLPRSLPKAYLDMAAADTDTDLSLFYLGNTIYGHFTDGSRGDFTKWTHRETLLRVALYNGDYFDHSYQNLDFGGARGWENQFKSSVRSGGSGCWFTLGRVWWWRNIPPVPPLIENSGRTVITVPAARRAATRDGEDQFGVQKVHILYNYEPSGRIRFFQFDPVHPEAAIFAVH
jgi:hypothetical protein